MRPGPSLRSPPVVFRAGLWVLGVGERGARSTSCASVRGDMRSYCCALLGGPRSALRFGGNDRVGVNCFIWKRFGAHSGHLTALEVVPTTQMSR